MTVTLQPTPRLIVTCEHVRIGRALNAVTAVRVLCTRCSWRVTIPAGSQAIFAEPIPAERQRGRNRHERRAIASRERRDPNRGLVNCEVFALPPTPALPDPPAWRDWSEEGDTCRACGEGRMHFPQAENCSCHIAPPCVACTSVVLTCDACGEREDRQCATS